MFFCGFINCFNFSIFHLSVCFPPIKEFCSAELFGYKFTVPCNVEEILSANYGDISKWSRPREIFDYLNNIDWSKGIERSELDLPYTIRFFFKNGSINAERSLQEINNYFAKINKTLLTLPNDDDNFL